MCSLSLPWTHSYIGEPSLPCNYTHLSYKSPDRSHPFLAHVLAGNVETCTFISEAAAAFQAVHSQGAWGNAPPSFGVGQLGPYDCDAVPQIVRTTLLRLCARICRVCRAQSQKGPPTQNKTVGGRAALAREHAHNSIGIVLSQIQPRDGAHLQMPASLLRTPPTSRFLPSHPLSPIHPLTHTLSLYPCVLYRSSSTR